MDLAVRDFALVTLVGQLAASLPGQLVFKGGFVLRHVHGFLRFSKDVDANRFEPPEHKLDVEEVAAGIRGAGIHNVVRFSPNEPATDSARSLDPAGTVVASVPAGTVVRVLARRAGCTQPASSSSHDSTRRSSGTSSRTSPRRQGAECGTKG